MSRRKQYVECDHCGSHLDFGEKCDCRIVDNCDYCANKANKKGECYVCQVKHPELPTNFFENYLLKK